MVRQWRAWGWLLAFVAACALALRFYSYIVVGTFVLGAVVAVFFLRRSSSPMDVAARDAALAELYAKTLSVDATARLLEHLHSCALEDDGEFDLSSLPPGSPPDAVEAAHRKALAALIPAVYGVLQQHCRHRGAVKGALSLLTSLAPTGSGSASASACASAPSSLEESALGISPLPLLAPPSALLTVMRVLALHGATDPRIARFALMLLGILVNHAATFIAPPSQSTPPPPPPLPLAKDGAVATPVPPSGLGPLRLRLGDLALAADIVLDVLDAQAKERNVQLWGLYALLHLAASDEDLLADANDFEHLFTADGACSAWTAAAATRDMGTASSDAERLSDEGVEMLGDSLCAHIGARGGVLACHAALTRFGLRRTPLASADGVAPPAPPSAASGGGDERIASVAVLLVGVLAKSSPPLWRNVLECGLFDAVRRAVEEHAGGTRLHEVGSALLGVQAKLRSLTSHS